MLLRPPFDVSCLSHAKLLDGTHEAKKSLTTWLNLSGSSNIGKWRESFIITTRA
jgi:hypothetical protein